VSNEQKVIVVPGANALLSIVDLPLNCFQQTKVVLCQNEIPLNVTKEAFYLAKSQGSLTIWNPAPAPAVDCKEILPYVDVLCVNETEARALSRVDDLTNAIHLLSEKVSKGVIITLGKDGCMLMSRGSNNILKIPASSVDKVLDTTGAGDCFCGSLALFLSRNATLARAVELANIVAGESVRRLGAQASYPTLLQCPSAVRNFLQPAKL
jgi:ribokinase